MKNLKRKGGLAESGIALAPSGDFGVANYITIGIPPYKDAETAKFYKDMALGLPTEKSIGDFGQKLSGALSSK